MIDRQGGYAFGEASVKRDSRSWKKDGIAKNFGCGTLPFASLRASCVRPYTFCQSSSTRG
jgi:hypothetical protein